MESILKQHETILTHFSHISLIEHSEYAGPSQTSIVQYANTIPRALILSQTFSLPLRLSLDK